MNLDRATASLSRMRYAAADLASGRPTMNSADTQTELIPATPETAERGGCSSAAPCSPSPHPKGKHVARQLEAHARGSVWIRAKCAECGAEWNEKYDLEFAYEAKPSN